MATLPVHALPSIEMFSERLKLALELAGMSQSDLARRIDRTPQAVQKMASGKSPSYRGGQLPLMAEVLKVPLAWLAWNNAGPAALAHQKHRDQTRPVAITFDTTGLTPLQLAGIEALASLMRAGDYQDEEVIDLLGELKPRLKRLKAA